jgi:hypothetical protein
MHKKVEDLGFNIGYFEKTRISTNKIATKDDFSMVVWNAC